LISIIWKILKVVKKWMIKNKYMRNTLLKAVRSHAQGHVAKHVANVEVYLNQSVGIGEHSDIIEAIEMELEEMQNTKTRLIF
jgi:predicted nucleic acid-binding protein